MDDFLTPEAPLRCRARVRRRAGVLLLLVLSALCLLVFLCLSVRTDNVRPLLIASWLSMLFLGWAALAFYLFSLEPARAELRHLESLLEAEPREAEGVLFRTGDAFRIPKSVPVVKLRLETEGDAEPLSLNLNAKLESRLPPDGSRVRVPLRRKFVTALEVLQPGPAPESVSPPARGKAFLRAVGRFLPAAFLWALAVLIGVGFLFTRITDAAPADKIVIYAHCDLKEAPELARKMELQLGGAVRMVKIHPFSYALFGSQQLKTADLYLLPDFRLQEFGDWFAPLPGGGEDRLCLYDPEGAPSPVGKYFSFAETAPGERWWICFGAASPHREDGVARRAAEILLALENKAPDAESGVFSSGDSAP